MHRIHPRLLKRKPDTKAAVGSAALRGATATDTQEVAAVKAFIAAINAQDFGALSALTPDDHTFVDSGGTTVTGREKMLSGWRHYYAMFPDYRITVDAVLQNGAVVAGFGSWSATYPGKRERAAENAVGDPDAWQATVKDGQIKTWQVYADHTKTVAVMNRDAQ